MKKEVYSTVGTRLKGKTEEVEDTPVQLQIPHGVAQGILMTNKCLM
jgi:hypothetical protein